MQGKALGSQMVAGLPVLYTGKSEDYLKCEQKQQQQQQRQQQRLITSTDSMSLLQDPDKEPDYRKNAHRQSLFFAPQALLHDILLAEFQA